MKACIKVNAGNDTNGNPRRGWVILAGNGDVADFVDEGYCGVSILYEKYPEFKGTYWPTEFSVTPGEYRELKKNRRRK